MSLPPYRNGLSRIAMICVHTSPLAPLGSKDAGGMNVYVRELSRELDKQGFKVDVFTRRKDSTTPEISHLSANARVIQVNAGPAEDYPKDTAFDHLPEFTCNVRGFAEEHELDYDLVHSHYWLSGWSGWLLKNWWNIPMIHMFHTLGQVKNAVAEDPGQMETIRRIEVEKHLVAVADRVVAGSPMDKAQLARLYGAPADRIEVIPCGVDLTLFRPVAKDVSRPLIGENGNRLVLFVGRIEPLKGLSTLIEALARMKQYAERGEDVVLLVIGGDSGNNGHRSEETEMERLRQFAADQGLGDRVKFLGPRPQEELTYYYSAADVTVVPSRYESFGMVALESMACGTPVIASRVGGLTSTVEDGTNGFLVPGDNPQALASKLELILGDDALRRQLGRQAAASVQQYAWPSIARRLIDLYSEVSGRPDPTLHRPGA